MGKKTENFQGSKIVVLEQNRKLKKIYINLKVKMNYIMLKRILTRESLEISKISWFTSKGKKSVK